MANVVYKYGPIIYDHDILTCKGEPIHVGLHTDGKMYVWCKLVCEVDEPDRHVQLFATSEEFVGDYIGTVISARGFVFHLVEIH